MLEKASTDDGLDVYRKKMIDEDGGNIKFTASQDDADHSGGATVDRVGVNRKIEEACCMEGKEEEEEEEANFTFVYTRAC